MPTLIPSSSGAHILIFPYPAQGHMIPLLDFAHQLSLHNLTITILITPKNLPILNPLLSINPSIKTLVLPFPNHPKLPQGAENVKDLTPDLFYTMMQAMSGLYNPILEWFKSHPSPPVALISDFFLGWTQHLACELGIPRINFSPSGAMAIAVMDSLFQNVPELKTHDQIVSLPDIPSSPFFPWWQLPSLFRSSLKRGDPESEFIGKSMLANLDSWGIVLNSFSELESVYLDYLRKKPNGLGYYNRVWAVGPILPSVAVTGASKERGGSGSVSTDDILSWLDSCPDNSVVYVCFGSQAVLSNKQMEEVANGLESSGVRFLWGVKQPTTGHAEGDYSVVPAGFEERTAGRGMVIRGWAPQLPILRHRSVRSFVTHCGWNSVLEGLTSGVVMLTWPMRAEQFVNATLLVDQAKVAIRACEGLDTVPNSVELSRILSDAVSENGLELRVRAMKLCKASLAAVDEGGSSFTNLNSFVKDLSGLGPCST
ncbi:hypothetical protein MKW94_026108 [Papaver nudicaule]|uniref:Uncharacterized protein n=1 Tax=Papaver nudicaule TaxID=74823 RepID=A0AA41SIK0_PAPNU|nr:hypothetical protein [Papaver nudicaule]